MEGKASSPTGWRSSSTESLSFMWGGKEGWLRVLMHILCTYMDACALFLGEGLLERRLPAESKLTSSGANFLRHAGQRGDT